MAERRPKAARKVPSPPRVPKEPERPFSAREQALLFGAWPELSGSASGAFTYGLYCQAVRALCHNAQDDPETIDVARIAARRFMAGVAPRDPVEGMMAAQLLGLHDAAMECFRRGAMREQPGEYRDQNLTQANRLVRSYAAAGRGARPAPGQGAAAGGPGRAGHRRTPAGRRSWARSPGGRGEWSGKRRTTPCTAALRMNRACRCGARTRGGSPCRSPAVRERARCRMHGGAAGRGRRRATGTPGDTAVARPRRWRCGGWRAGWRARRGAWWGWSGDAPASTRPRVAGWVSSQATGGR
jgi:hypothetical protein